MKNEKLVTDNLKLVHAVINRLFPAYRGDEDVFAEGTLGLVKAADSFDTESRANFSTYAFCLIRNEIISYLRRERRFAGTISLDEPIGDDGEGNEVTLGDTIATEDVVESLKYPSGFYDVFSTLSERNKTIVMLNLWGYTPDEIAKKVHTGATNTRRILREVYKEIAEAVGD